MKTTLLSILFAITSVSAFGQISITVGGAAHTSGTSYYYASDTNDVTVNALVNNTTSSPINLTVQRVMLNPISSWIDDLCWATSSDGGLSGQCYNSIQTSNPYNTPNTYTVDPGDNGIFKAIIKPKDPDYGCGDYRYYIIQNGSVVLDSIDVSVCKTLSVDELTPMTISVAPNPANDYFTVKMNDAKEATIKVVDVLGNIVLKETAIEGSKTISTSNLRNGVYFVTVEAEGQRPINRKVIVRH